MKEIQELCERLARETDAKKLIAIIEELRTALARQKTELEARLAANKRER